MNSKQESLDKVAATISQLSDEVAGLEEDIEGLTKAIAELDKSVAEATIQRKSEHAEYAQTLQLTEAAVQLIGKAKNRLNKFYNPTIYKAAPKVEMSMEDKIMASYGFVQRHSALHSASQKRQMPPLPELP